MRATDTKSNPMPTIMASAPRIACAVVERAHNLHPTSVPITDGTMLATNRLQDIAIESMLRIWPESRPRGHRSFILPRNTARRATVQWPSAYEWALADVWGDQYRHALEQVVPVRIAEIPQPFAGVILTRFDIDGRSYDVAFDYSDDPMSIHDGCVRQCLVTFKAQYLAQGYGIPRVLPTGYIPGSELLYKMLPYLRWLRRTRLPLFDVYGRFGSRFGTGIRAPALTRLSATRRFRFEGGLQMVGYSRYLREMARARVVVDLPGNGPFCFRLIEYLAVGACVVAYPHHAAMPVPLADGEQLVYIREDLSDLEEQCERCLADTDLRVRLGARAQEYFDRYLHRDQLGSYVVSSVLEQVAET